MKTRALNVTADQLGLLRSSVVQQQQLAAAQLDAVRHSQSSITTATTYRLLSERARDLAVLLDLIDNT